jgi:hypothetical protein
VLSEGDRLKLEQSFSKTELHAAVFGSNALGAPGPDGFYFFYFTNIFGS